jgi:hypothetical protein
VLHRAKGSVPTLVVRLPDDNLNVVSQAAMTVPSLRGIIHQLAARRHRKATARKAGPASRTTSLNPTSTCWPGCHSRNRLCHRIHLSHRMRLCRPMHLAHRMHLSIMARHTHSILRCQNIRVLFTSIPTMCIRGTSIAGTGSRFRRRGVTVPAWVLGMASVPVAAAAVAAAVVVLEWVQFDREWSTVPVCAGCV